MKDIYGEDYLIISRYDYEKMLAKIDRLEKVEKEYCDYVTKIANTCMQSSEQMAVDTMSFLLHNGIQITPKNMNCED